MRRAAIISVLCVSGAVACSYNWTTAGPPTSEEGGTPDVGTDAGQTAPPDPPARDSGTRDATTGPRLEECGASCRCSNNETCDFTCTTGDCQVTCEDQARCKVTCTGRACNIICNDDAQCQASCVGGGCRFDCNGESTCSGRCTGGAQCIEDCGRNATCDVQCNPRTDCL